MSAMGGEPRAGGLCNGTEKDNNGKDPQYRPTIYFSRSAQNNPSNTHASVSTANDVRFRQAS